MHAALHIAPAIELKPSKAVAALAEASDNGVGVLAELGRC